MVKTIMEEKEILTLLTQMSQRLDEGENHIIKNEWDAVESTFSEIHHLQERIKKNKPSVETLLSQSTSFNKEYEPLKNTLLEKTNKIIAAIETWRVDQREKISSSKNVLNNMAKYFKPTNTAYYIDTKE